jgi:hypothetical protein
MSISNFKDLIKSDEYNKVFFEEYEFMQTGSLGDNIKFYKRDNYRIKNLKHIEFPELLLNLVNGVLDNLKIEIFIKETQNDNNVNYYCSMKSDLEHYKFIEDIYYDVNLNCDNNNVINLDISIDKRYNENKINDIDKIFLNIFLLFIENNYKEYVKEKIFIKKLQKLNLHSFVLNII